jgi:hypothetical protein
MNADSVGGTMRARRSLSVLLCFAVFAGGALAATGALAAAPKPAPKTKVPLLYGNPSNRRLAGESLMMLQAEDMAGLKIFLAPQFLIQRGDGTYLDKAQYLADPSEVDSFKIRGVVGTNAGGVRVIRFEANTRQRIEGKEVAGGWIPRLSTFIKEEGIWKLISHANFLLPPPTS